VTSGGGGSANCSGGCGAIFKVQEATRLNHVYFTYDPVYSFVGGVTDGFFPKTGVAGDASGNAYGLTEGGGGGYGTIFEYSP
jgi:hypothetical protein